MSNLYRLDADAARIAMRFRADAGGDPWTGGEARPTGYLPIILRTADGVRRLAPRQWGVPPPPKVALVGGHPVAHVRNLESPFWIGTLRHTAYRCLVPVTAFRLLGQGKDPTTGRRAQHWLSVSGSPIFAFAGIWQDSEVPSFALLSCEANRIMGALGAESMPLILDAEDHEAWLREDWKAARRLVVPFPSQRMTSTVGMPPAVMPF
jgi:putative SOS response-associated peptidase YedK